MLLMESRTRARSNSRRDGVSLKRHASLHVRRERSGTVPRLVQQDTRVLGNTHFQGPSTWVPPECARYDRLEANGLDVHGELDEAVRVAPLVVVPRHELDEGLGERDACKGVEDRRARVALEIGRH